MRNFRMFIPATLIVFMCTTCGSPPTSTESVKIVPSSQSTAPSDAFESDIAQEITYPVHLELSRDYTWVEFNREAKLKTLYLYENYRPAQRLSNVQQDGEPYIKDNVCILPNGELSDEQLLQIIDYKCASLPTDSFMPNASELQYWDVKGELPNLVKKYGISDGAPDDSFLALVPMTLPKSRKAEWRAFLIYNDGPHYSIIVNAADGALISWQRCPNGYFTDIKPEIIRPYSEITDAEKMRLNSMQEELFKVARDYAVRTCGSEVLSCGLDNTSIVSTVFFGTEAGMAVELELSDRSLLRVVVLEDLSIVYVKKS